MNIGNEVPERQALKEGLYYALGEYYGSSLQEIPFGEVFYNVIDAAVKARIKMPAQLVMFSKSLITMEGFCRQLYPGFNIVEEGKPFVKKLLAKQLSLKGLAKESISNILAMKKIILNTPNYVREFSNQIKIIEKSIVELDERFKRFQDQMFRMTKGIILGIMLAAMLMSSALFINIEPKYFNASLLSWIGYCFSILLVILILITLHNKRIS